MNAYGPNQRPVPPFGDSRVRKITPSFVCRALAGMPVELYGDGSQVSDMVYVGDVAEVLVNALEKAIAGEVFPGAVEVGPAEHTSVKQFAEMVIEMCDSDSEIVCLPMRPGEIPNSTVCADTKTLSLVDMSPADLVPLREGLARTIEYFRSC
jgi:UDP-glucose 4-epimerase